MNTNITLNSKLFRFFIHKNFSSSNEFQKTVQICVLGANTELGQATSLLLKQNPLVSSLKLYSDASISNTIADLEHVDTRCKVKGYEGLTMIGKALRGADIVLMLGSDEIKESTSLADRIMMEGRRVVTFTEEFAKFSPRAILIVNISPVSVSTPLAAEVLKKTHWYHPARLVGSAAVAQMKANTIFGRCQDLDPQICQVPIVGGPDIDLAVPLFSRAKPIELNDATALELVEKFRGVKKGEFPKVMGNENFVENNPFSGAFALNTMLSNICAGLCGNKNANYNAFVRSNILPTCQHLVTTLQFSRGGVVHNFGLPQLTNLELKILEKALLQLKQREQMAKEFMEYIDNGAAKVPPFKVKDTQRKKLLQQSVFSGC